MYGFRVEPEGLAHRAGAVHFGGLAVTAADHVPLTPVQTEAGATFGVLIGWPIDGEAWLAGNGPLTVPAPPADPAAFYRDRLQPMRGSWIAILAIAGRRQAWLDPMGTLSLVWDVRSGRAGGTAADLLCPAEYASRLDAQLRAALGVERDGWFPGGLTAHRDIERLLPNHALDLDSGIAHRHEHYADAVTGTVAVEDHLDVLAQEIRSLARGIAASGRPLAMGLTGGGDSRMMLSALRGQTDGILFYTLDGGIDRFDTLRAQELAQLTGIEWRALPIVTAAPARQQEWDHRVGHCVATANREIFPSIEPLADRVSLGGLGGEVGRCFLWRDMAAVPARMKAREIVDRLKLPRLPVVEQRTQQWLEALPERDPLRVLDIAYIEQRMGPWAFSQSWSNPCSLVLHPLASAAALRAMLALPPEYRQGDGMVSGLIERCWPELLALPINRYGDWRDLRRQAARLARPDRAWRKLRQIVRTRRPTGRAT